jgi:hypothetical protein
MIDRAMLRLGAALPFCVAMLLAACGSQAADSDATPVAGGVAGTASGARSGGTGAAQAESGGASTTDDGATAQAQADADDGGGEDGGGEDGSDWPELRDVPDGTLTWTVVYTGTGTTENSESKEVVVLHRKLEGTAHMTGAMGNAGDTPTSAPLDDINKAMEACGDDMACQRKAAMQAMAAIRKDPKAFERSVGGAMKEAQRDTLWAADDCDITGEADDRSTWSGMTPLGFNTGHGVRAGKQAVEGCGEGESARLVADDNTHTYRLAIPQARIRVPASFNGKREESLGRYVLFPALEIKGMRYARLDRPLKGSASLRTGSGTGLYSEGWSTPLAEEVSWTFTPDPR